MKHPARAALLAALTLALVAPASVSANHELLRATIQVQHYNDVNVAEYTATVSCDGTYCFVQVPANSRDLGRVLRWCGDTTVDLTIEAPHSASMIECYGSSTWKVRIVAGLWLDANNVSSHDQDVAVEIQVVKG
jgi:hypothetical protein